MLNIEFFNIEFVKEKIHKGDFAAAIFTINNIKYTKEKIRDYLLSHKELYLYKNNYLACKKCNSIFCQIYYIDSKVIDFGILSDYFFDGLSCEELIIRSMLC